MLKDRLVSLSKDGAYFGTPECFCIRKLWLKWFIRALLYIMIIEERRDGYRTEMFGWPLDAIEIVMFVDEYGSEKPFEWCTRTGLN